MIEPILSSNESRFVSNKNVLVDIVKRLKSLELEAEIFPSKGANTHSPSTCSVDNLYSNTSQRRYPDANKNFRW